VKRLLIETANRLVILAVAVCMVVFGYRNFLASFGTFMMPSITPIAVLTAAIPVAGGLITLFVMEELINGWRRGFESPEGVEAGLVLPPVV
jgi:TRAP-type C4-dicarboxylate transport system permease small subunit